MWGKKHNLMSCVMMFKKARRRIMLQSYNDKITQQKRAQTTNRLTCTDDPLLTCTDDPPTQWGSSLWLTLCSSKWRMSRVLPAKSLKRLQAAFGACHQPAAMTRRLVQRHLRHWDTSWSRTRMSIDECIHRSGAIPCNLEASRWKMGLRQLF